MSWWTCVGQVCKGVDIFKLLRLDPSRNELCHDEAETDWRFSNQITGSSSGWGTNHLGRCECCGEFLTDLLSHKDRELVDGCCPGG
jgi:hypothetical protein